MARIQSMYTMKRIGISLSIFAAVVMMAGATWAQLPKLPPRPAAAEPAQAVSFEFVFEGARPPHYAIVVESTGRAAYRSDDAIPRPKADDDTPPYLVNFQVSSTNTERIFELARSLNNFQGDFEYRGGRLANMGAKTLTFTSGATTNKTTYNYSQNQYVQQLTTLFQGMGSALEYRRRLERLYRYEKLGLEAELKAMEEDVKRNYIAELQVDEAILRQIMGDPSVMNISRKRAENILRRMSNESADQARQ